MVFRSENTACTAAFSMVGAEPVVGEEDEPENTDVKRLEVVSCWREQGLSDLVELFTATRVALD